MHTNNDWFYEYFINEVKAIGRQPASNMQYEVVDSLPSSGNEQTIYFVKNDSSSTNDYYDEYVWISSSSSFEKIGNTQIDSPTTQPDWNQNDATQPDYVKNRPFYTGDPVETVLVEETTVAFEDSGAGFYGAKFESTFSPIVGETYKVSWDGSVYESTCVESRKHLAIGNLSIMGDGSDTGEPFLMVISNAGRIAIVTQNTSASHTISISGTVTQVVKIDEKYLPDTVATKSEVEVAQSTANNAQTTANNAQSTANNALSTANTAKSTANNALSTANTAKSTADTAKSKVEKALTVESSGNILAPVTPMIKGTYQKLLLSSEDSKVQSSFGVTGSTGLQITVGRDGGFGAPVSNPSTVEFINNGGRYMCLKGIDELILNSSTEGSTKKFKITVDDTGAISATEVT